MSYEYKLINIAHKFATLMSVIGSQHLGNSPQLTYRQVNLAMID